MFENCICALQAVPGKLKPIGFIIKRKSSVGHVGFVCRVGLVGRVLRIPLYS